MASSPSNTTVSINAPGIGGLNSTLGALEIGTYVSLVLYGLLLHQAYKYYDTYPSDKILLKSYVALILTGETLCTILNTHACYYYSVSNYFNPEALLYMSWSANMMAISGGTTIFISQSFFVYRVWLINKKYRPLVVVSVVLMLLEFSLCLAATIKGFQLKTWALFAKWVWLVSIHNAASTVSDLFVTIVLIHTLRRNRGSIKRTDSILGTLILYAVSTSFITALYNSICFIMIIALPGDLIYAAVTMVGIRLYSNSLLAALNCRLSITGRHCGEIAMMDTTAFGISGRSDGPAQVKSIDTTRLDSRRLQKSADGSMSATRASAQTRVPIDIKINTVTMTDFSRKTDFEKVSLAP